MLFCATRDARTESATYSSHPTSLHNQSCIRTTGQQHGGFPLWIRKLFQAAQRIDRWRASRAELICTSSGSRRVRSTAACPRLALSARIADTRHCYVLHRPATTTKSSEPRDEESLLAHTNPSQSPRSALPSSLATLAPLPPRARAFSRRYGGPSHPTSSTFQNIKTRGTCRPLDGHDGAFAPIAQRWRGRPVLAASRALVRGFRGPCKPPLWFRNALYSSWPLANDYSTPPTPVLDVAPPPHTPPFHSPSNLALIL